MQLKKIVLSAVMTVIALSGEAKGLTLKVYNPGTSAIFPVTSTIVYGKKDAALIDAQFQKQYAEQVVKEIKDMKKNLKYVFVSYHDPDYYFGLNVIHKAFPEAKIISTAQTAYLIEASKDMKLDVWKKQLGTDAHLDGRHSGRQGHRALAAGDQRHEATGTRHSRSCTFRQ